MSSLRIPPCGCIFDLKTKIRTNKYEAEDFLVSFNVAVSFYDVNVTKCFPLYCEECYLFALAFQKK